MPVHAIVLAAGKGTRMRSDDAKVLHRAAGRTLLDWVLEAVADAGADRTVVVVGHAAEAVEASLPPEVEAVLQEPQNGTGHAVQVALAHLGEMDSEDTVLVSYGDMPLVPGEVYDRLATRPVGSAATIVTVDPGPTGFGRIVRDADGIVASIVEERDCTPAQATLTERNVGIYSFRAGDLVSGLGKIDAHNAQGEFYLTDVVGTLAAEGHAIDVVAADGGDVVGVNTHADLARVQAALQARINDRLLSDGVWMLDPARTYVDTGVVVEPGARLYPGTVLEGATVVRAGATVGPDTFVRDSHIGADALVWYSVLRQARVGEGAEVGPYASLRPGTVLHEGSKAGTFVETKETVVGKGAKVPHLSYLGDAEIGAGANIGAGTITCNYDGHEKHRTVVGEGAFIGSDTMLVAPVTIGPGAVTGAGSVIDQDVSAGALAVERSLQKEVPGYAERRAARRRAREADPTDSTPQTETTD